MKSFCLVAGVGVLTITVFAAGCVLAVGVVTVVTPFTAFRMKVLGRPA